MILIKSFYFQTTPCKHPIIILKDTGRDEASAMLEFAYTGEVNVAQDLLPSLLHTARSFRIKGLDKVENPVDAPPPVSLVITVDYTRINPNKIKINLKLIVFSFFFAEA